MIYIGIFIALFGLILGSFVNALVWRLHEQLDADGNTKKLSKSRRATLSITKGRSMCTNCGHTLASKDLVPVISWLTLRGKCRYCKKTISSQYPLIELLTGILFAISYFAWPYGFADSWQILGFVTWLVMVVGFVALSVYDIKWMLLPDRIVYKLYIIAFLSYIFQIALGRPLNSIVDVVFGVLVGGGIFWLLFQVSGGKWIGGGDVKLGFLLGFIVGSGQLAFLTLFFASLLGIVLITPSLISKKITKSSKVPFGPFLICGAFIAVLWGQQILNWYTNTFLNFT